MIKRVFLVFALLLLIFSGASQATTLHQLYQLKVEVADQSPAERKQGIARAFDLLLVRITGDNQIAEHEKAEALRLRARQWVRQFRYEEVTPPVPPADGNGGDIILPKPYLQLLIRFDEKAVNKALWDSQLPVWGKTRPAVLVWIAIQDEQRRALVDPNEVSELHDAMRAHAQRRGLPLVFPLMDLEDQMNISVNDVWANFSDSIELASARYVPEATLVGRVQTDFFGAWQVRWTLYQGGRSQSWAMPAAGTFEDVAIAGIDGVADDLAQRYAHVRGDDDGAYWLEVGDVRNLQDYVRVSRYLESLEPVKGVYVTQLGQSSLSFRLTLRGSINAVEQAISLGSTLKSQQEERFSERVLMYRLQP
jgi:hypothetical protein